MKNNIKEITSFVKEEFFSVTKGELKDLENFLGEHLPGELAAAQARITELEAALLPFSELDTRHIASRKDDWIIFAINDTQFTLGDVRKARAALTGK